MIKDAIKNFFNGDVSDDAETLVRYSHDASLLEVKPKLVVFPKNAEDIKSLVRYVSEHKKEDSSLSITARSAGTCMSGGPLNDSIIADVTKYMNGTLSVSNEKGAESATVLPGTFYRDFEKETLKKGVLLPSYTASKGLCAIGGMVGNNSGGEKTLLYGKTENYIKSQKVIFSDGKNIWSKRSQKRNCPSKSPRAILRAKSTEKFLILLTRTKDFWRMPNRKSRKIPPDIFCGMSGTGRLSI